MNLSITPNFTAYSAYSVKGNANAINCQKKNVSFEGLFSTNTVDMTDNTLESFNKTKSILSDKTFETRLKIRDFFAGIKEDGINAYYEPASMWNKVENPIVELSSKNGYRSFSLDTVEHYRNGDVLEKYRLTDRVSGGMMYLKAHSSKEMSRSGEGKIEVELSEQAKFEKKYGHCNKNLLASTFLKEINLNFEKDS